MGRGGKRGPRVTELTENPTAIEIVFEGDQYTHSKSDAKKFTLDPTASPKRITLNYMSGTSEEESFGIYKFEGDRLILCWQGVTEAYPESFRMNTSDDGRTIWSLQRISDLQFLKFFPQQRSTGRPVVRGWRVCRKWSW